MEEDEINAIDSGNECVGDHDIKKECKNESLDQMRKIWLNKFFDQMTGSMRNNSISCLDNSISCF